QLSAARLFIADMPPPSLFELLKQANVAGSDSLNLDIWLPMCLQACDQALADLDVNRLREGKRLAQEMTQCAAQIDAILEQVEEQLPQILQAHQDKITQRLREALQNVHPEGF